MRLQQEYVYCLEMMLLMQHLSKHSIIPLLVPIHGNYRVITLF